MGAADCITGVMSDAQQYNMRNMNIKTQPHKHICIPIYKYTINKRETKANILPLVMFNLRHALGGLYIQASLKGITTCIWSFSCSFACDTTMGCCGFKLSFGIIILLQLLTIIK